MVGNSQRMLLPQKIWLALAVFLFTCLTGHKAESQTPFKNPKTAQLSKKAWKIIDGFRSAKFGLNEKQVLEAITKDFKISKNKVKRNMASVSKNIVLTIHLPKFMEIGGPTNINYLMGYKSKKLIQVNATWGAEVTKNFKPIDVVNLSDLLREHFIKKRYKKVGYTLNKKLKNGDIIIFSGRDQKDRMILFRLKSPKVKIKNKKKEISKNVSLVLSYIQSTTNSDVFRPKIK